MKTAMLKLTALAAGCLLSLSAAAAAAVNFTSEVTGVKADGYTVNGISFYNTVTSGYMEVDDYQFQSNGKAIAANDDSNGNALKMTFSPTSVISMAFGNDDPFFTNPGDLALLQVFNGATLVGFSSVVLNRDDEMNQSISFNGDSFDSAIFSYVDPSFNPYTGGGADINIGLIEIIDNISLVPEPETYAMLLTGLGLLGFMARRRKESAV
ncbi:putative secreted protein with PEP-CTERM sorting signal [Nitrosomonas sp. Nm84]|uniref:PEP-CTERM sorting domain-containing protein n=1 Tax=Nitrosomonas sp. Nm84 TaxID=200124 RepID=UPI000D8D18DB|nr:PEP-CTERM sorting domain-containing protein [Nitrosomonas sp. Nm84]PXW83901.1 putative secreted protein with PEP-CTERM sorting signal [Nitrosomonas sp. Nm84]